jgi:hypothetical protein
MALRPITRQERRELESAIERSEEVRKEFSALAPHLYARVAKDWGAMEANFRRFLRTGITEEGIA